MASSKTFPRRMTRAGNINIPFKKKPHFDPATFLATAGLGRTIVHLGSKRQTFSQGDSADEVFYIQSGRIRLSVVAKTGKEATIALLGQGDFCGEECIAAAQPVRMATATNNTTCVLLKIEREEVMRALARDQCLARVFG